MQDFLAVLFIALGVLSLIISAIGVLRFPDFYTRLHAASIGDTLAAALILLGLAVAAGWSLVAAKLIFVLLFLFMTSPTASHALAQTAWRDGIRPEKGTGLVKSFKSKKR